MNTLRVLASAFLLLVAACSSDNTVGPSAGSETTNGMTVAVVDSTVSGIAGPGVIVAIYAADYLPHRDLGFADTVLVGADSAYVFAGLEPGTYRLVAIDQSGGLGAYVDSLTVGIRNDTVGDTVQFDSLRSMEGRVTLSQTPQELCVVFVPGTPWFDSTDAAGEFRLESLPGSTCTLVAEYVPRGTYSLYVDTATVSGWGNWPYVELELQQTQP